MTTTDIKPVPLSTIDSAHNLKQALSVGLEMLTPPPNRSIDEWARQERKLEDTHAEPGKYNVNRTPYCREIMRLAKRTDVKNAVVIMGSRMGKTMSMQNIAGYYMQDDPSRILHVCQTRENANGEVREEIEDLIKGCKKLARLQITGRGTNQLTKKFLNGAVYKLVWAGSASQLAGMNARIVIVDEYDRVPSNSEGDVLTQAAARSKAYGMSAFVLTTSTPTTGRVETYVHESTGIQHWRVGDGDDIQSPVWLEWQTGTRHEWAVQCPKCFDYFVPRSELLTWVGEDLSDVAESAGLTCFNCGEVLKSEQDKNHLQNNGLFLSPGEYVGEDGKVYGEGVKSPTISLWVSGLLNPWVSFADAAVLLKNAQASRKEKKMIAVINTGFGELYWPTEEKLEWESVRLCESDYKQGTVPEEVQVIYMSCDVQGDRIYWVVRGWNNKRHSWLIDHGELHGPTDELDVWEKLHSLAGTKYAGRPIDMVGVDSGYRSNIVYEFCRRDVRRYKAFKGTGNKSSSILSEKAVQTRTYFKSKADYFGVKYITASDPFFKEGVHACVKRGPSEYKDWHVFKNVDEEYCRQVVAETEILMPSGKSIWKKTGENHYFDCEWIQQAIAEHKRVDLLPDRAAQQSQDQHPTQESRKVRSNWANPRRRY